MPQRILVGFLMILALAGTASAKWKPEEQQYLDESFRVLREQVRALQAQVEAQTVALTALRQQQEQLQSVVTRQQALLEALQKAMTEVRANQLLQFAKLSTGIQDLRTEQQKAFNTLSGLQAVVAITEPATKPASASPTPLSLGYVTGMVGEGVTLDIGYAHGVRRGTRLAWYKASDPQTRVGVLEVTDVVGASKSRARIITVNPGVRPEFSDMVRPE